MASIRRNSYRTDPALAASFDNLTIVFKTPSGADIAGYAIREDTLCRSPHDAFE